MRLIHFAPLLALLLLPAGGCATKAQVAKVLKEDPELLMQALEEHRFEVLEMLNRAVTEQREQAERERMEQDLDAGLAPEIQGDRPIQGRAEAPVLIVEYSDFLCPFCVRGHETMNRLLKEHPDQVRVLYKHNPIKQGSYGLAAIYEAIAGMDQEKAIDFKEFLFANQEAIHQEIAGGLRDAGKVVPGLIRSLELDPDEVFQRARDPEIARRIEADVREAREFGLEGTPMYVVGSVPVRGAQPMARFEEVVGQVMERLAGDCADCVQ
jgi:protein-disulfide isomerase